ncbi:protein of unknown function [uncultured Woeseiaceae bacterium]|uniref:Uncharacterized protein n=1 Tax=uncultured Woeseiaceae bacterium TaxID=1983305 RepID=A0A7D9D0Z8_9GAMM|nr:protein of unknown function [uncultured Woeseiaceae bacterium]
MPCRNRKIARHCPLNNGEIAEKGPIRQGSARANRFSVRIVVTPVVTMPRFQMEPFSKLFFCEKIEADRA